MSYDNQQVTTKWKKEWFLHQLKPPLGDPPHDTARQDIVSCILTSMHWTPDCWQSSRVQDVPKNTKNTLKTMYMYLLRHTIMLSK